jgi:hypothetical protein
MPHKWKIGSDVSLHIHWCKDTSAAGTVNWQMKYKWCNIGDVMPGFSVMSSGTEMIPNSNTANKHALYEWADLPGAGKTLSSMLCIYLERVSAGDTYGGSASLYEIDLHYQIDSIGSREEYIK